MRVQYLQESNDNKSFIIKNQLENKKLSIQNKTAVASNQTFDNKTSSNPLHAIGFFV